MPSVLARAVPLPRSAPRPGPRKRHGRGAGRHPATAGRARSSRRKGSNAPRQRTCGRRTTAPGTASGQSSTTRSSRWTTSGAAVLGQLIRAAAGPPGHRGGVQPNQPLGEDRTVGTGRSSTASSTSKCPRADLHTSGQQRPAPVDQGLTRPGVHHPRFPKRPRKGDPKLASGQSPLLRPEPGPHSGGRPDHSASTPAVTRRRSPPPPRPHRDLGGGKLRAHPTAPHPGAGAAGDALELPVYLDHFFDE